MPAGWLLSARNAKLYAVLHFARHITGTIFGKLCDRPLTVSKGGLANTLLDLQAVWHETEQYSCLQECVCPAGDGPCTPSSHCSPQSFACKHGYHRFSDGSALCYPVGCQEGALQVCSSSFHPVPLMSKQSDGQFCNEEAHCCWKSPVLYAC